MNAHTTPPTPMQVIEQIVAIHAPGHCIDARQRLEREIVRAIARSFTTPGLFDVIDYAMNLEAEAQELHPRGSDICDAAEQLFEAARLCRDAAYDEHPDT